MNNLTDFFDEDINNLNVNEEDDNDYGSKDLKVVYVLYLGQDCDEKRIYQFLIANDESEVWAEDWNEKPAANCRYLTPDENMYDYVKELKTDIIFDLAQDNCCVSMQDVRDHVHCLASENLDNSEEYPENGRIVVQFGDSLYDVEKMLAKRDLSMNFI